LITMRWDRLLVAVEGFLRAKAYLRDLAAQRRAGRGKDLISALVAADSGDHSCMEDVLANCAFMLMAAYVNTTNLIGNGLLALLRHPDQLRSLREQPALLASAVEEVLRYDSPVQFITRQARESTSIGGKQIAKGQMVFLVLGAANHDPE